MRLKMLGIDPGPNSGIVLCNGVTLVEREQIPGLRDFGTSLEKILRNWEPDVLIFEDFNVKDHRATNGTDTKDVLDVIGVLKYIALGVSHDMIVVRQWNSDKRKITDEMLAEKAWLARPKKEWRHANDAARHVLRWALKEGVDLHAR